MFLFGKRRIRISNANPEMVRVKFTDGKESTSTQVEVGSKVGLSQAGMGGGVARTMKKEYKKEEPGFSMIQPGTHMQFEAKQPIATVKVKDVVIWDCHRIPSSASNYIVTKRGDIVPGKRGNHQKCIKFKFVQNYLTI